MRGSCLECLRSLMSIYIYIVSTHSTVVSAKVRDLIITTCQHKERLKNIYTCWSYALACSWLNLRSGAAFHRAKIRLMLFCPIMRQKFHGIPKGFPKANTSPARTTSSVCSWPSWPRRSADWSALSQHKTPSLTLTWKLLKKTL